MFQHGKGEFQRFHASHRTTGVIPLAPGTVRAASITARLNAGGAFLGCIDLTGRSVRADMKKLVFRT
jgi:hypothetical protein